MKIRCLVAFCVVGLCLGSCVIEEDNDPGPGPGDPVAPDRAITCGHFDDFLLDCTSGCAPTWDCELSYDEMDIDTQIALDDCSDCLAANLADGYCEDCDVDLGGPTLESCQIFMEDLLGVDCW